MCKDFECLECSQIEINDLLDKLEVAEKMLGFYKINAQAWKDFADHQEYCAVCANSVDDCEDGSKLRAIANVKIEDVTELEAEEADRYTRRNEGLT